MTKRLLAVQGTLQFVAGYIAMQWRTQSAGQQEGDEAVLLMYDFFMSDSAESEFEEAIRLLASLHPWKSIVFISGSRMQSVMSGSYWRSIESLREIVGESLFDEIYLARDFCGDGSPLIINAYPVATKIIYGDGLGIVGNHVGLKEFDLQEPLRSVYGMVRTRWKKFRHGGPKKLPLNEAVLTLPQIWSQKYMQGVRLHIPSRQFVSNILKNISANLCELNEYSNALMRGIDGLDSCFIFLLSNLNGSGFMTAEREADLYVKIIQNIAPEGAVVLLKAHPRGSKIILNTISEKLNRTRRLIVLDDPRLSRLPIELWTELIQRCIVVPVFSASALHLSYIYNKDVLLPFDAAMIEKYVFKNKIAYVKQASIVIAQGIQRLKSWDGNTPLWKIVE